MDNVTHTLVGLSLARSPLGRRGRGITAALLLASNAPDIDVVSAGAGTGGYLQWHRGPTHGVVGVLGLALATASIVWSLRRLFHRRSTEPPAGFGWLVAASAVGVLLHVLMDLPTSYGTRLLSPFDWHWFSVDWMPIVDIYLLAALAGGLLIGAAASRRRSAAIAVLVFAFGNYGLRAIAHHEAMKTAARVFGPSLPARCDRGADPPAWGLEEWPRRNPASGNAQRTDPCLVEVAAMPTFVSPFKWRIIVQLSNAYDLHDIDLVDAWFPGGGSGAGFWRRAVRYPNQWTPAVATAATTRAGEVFLGFSRFPAARSLVEPGGAATVRWSDVRFAGGLLTLDQPAPWLNVLTARIRLAPDGHVTEEGIGVGSRGQAGPPPNRQDR